jgi:hypothetical protein
MEDLSLKSLSELKEYAKENNIDLKGARSKTKVLAAILGLDQESTVISSDDNIIRGTEPEKRIPVSSSFSNEENVIGSRSADRVEAEKKDITTPKKEEEKTALFSEKNMHWQGVGHLKTGYNIVTKEAASKWLTKNVVREATPQEVATYYGKS